MMFVKEPKESALTDKLIHKHEYEFLINHESICNSDIFILFLVLTAPKHFERRQDIRNTWGSIKIYNSAKLRIAFLVGEIEPATGDFQVEHKLRDESNQFQDIVQGNFIDTYKNLTYKTVFGLHWMQKHCRNTQFLFKADDDVVINVFRLVDFLQGIINGAETLSNFVYCERRDFGTADRVKKYKTSYAEYEYFWFPVYCHGPGYLMSKDVAVRLYNVTQYIPFLWLEDVFIGFGMAILELQITDNYYGYFFNIYNGSFYKIIELCILKHLRNDKSNMFEEWERIVSAHENRFTLYFIYFRLIGIFSLMVMTICVFAVLLKLAKSRPNSLVIYFCRRK